MTAIRTMEVELTSDDVRYILHSLNEFKLSCHEKVDEDEGGDGDLTHMYANDIMTVRGIYEKLHSSAKSVFPNDELKVSYEEL